MAKTEIKYNKTIEANNEKVYYEISRFLGEASHHMKFIGSQYTYYFFNKEETQIIRTDGRSRIEISDKVEQDIINLVENIFNSERRALDLR